MSNLLPKVYSSGGFGYAGLGGHAFGAHGEALALVTYDTKEGGSHGGLIAGGMGNWAAGWESSRTWSDWQEHSGPIGFFGKEIPGASTFFGRKLGAATNDFGGLAQWEDGRLNLGGYSGITMGSGRTYGGGAYVTLCWWNAC